MATIGTYVKQLLLKKERVILPGFGNLEIGEGTSQKEEGRLDPPGPVVRFDATYSRDDGKLAEAYAAGEGIDREEAQQQVLELVDAIRFALDRGLEYALEPIGVFRRNEDHKIFFKKNPEWVIDPDFFGLESLDLLELEEEKDEAGAGTGLQDKATPGTRKEEQEASPGEAPRPVSEKQPPSKQKETAMTPSRPAAKKSRAPVNKWKIIWIVTGSLIAVLVLFLLIPVNNQGGFGLEFGKDGILITDGQNRDDTPGEGTGETSAPGETGINGTETDEPGMEGNGTGESPAPGATVPGEEGAQDADKPVTAPRYYIIAGSFGDLDNATSLMDDLKSQGFPAELIRTENRMYRVAVKSYRSKQQAIDDLAYVKKYTGLEGCWVLSR